MFAGTEHVRRHADGVASGLQRLDRGAGGDPAHHGDGDRTAAVVLDADVGGAHLAERAFDDARREAAAAVAVTARRKLGQFDHFNRAGAVGQAPDKAALFQRGDQPVDAGLGAQIERVLHLVKGGRNA